MNSSRLGRIGDWRALARQANYRPRQLAALCAVSLRQLERYCKDAFQATPLQWLRRVRLDEAGRLLAQGFTAKAAAYELGFKQPSHFSREFKRQTGRTPHSFTTATSTGVASSEVARG